MPTLEDFLNHPVETLEKALHLRKQIDQLSETLKEMFGANPAARAGQAQELAARKPTRGRPKGKKMSAAVRAKMAAAQRVRWAKQSSTQGPATAVVMPATRAGKKGGMSAKGRAAVAAAQKARWAKVKAAKSSAPAKAAPVPGKKGGISPEGLARIKAAQKLRWAKVKKGK